ncbi:unnamed protein product [Leptidea sinapis]|uniref:Uncharacterized protein n=1 Tax=Leptidea sinapis TaxID=189913 RepID=A0A5E4QSI1_9NEOP|nr:unnamed protein product [Leptidea sinapis]
MEPYCPDIETYNKITNYLDKFRNSLDNTNSNCNIITYHLLNTQHFKFHASGIVNGVEYLANKLYEVLDSRFAEQYTQDIEIIKSNEKHLSNLRKNQISALETEFNVLKNRQTTVDKQHKLINKKLNEFEENTNTLQRDIQNVSHVQDFLLTSEIANSFPDGVNKLKIKTLFFSHLGHIISPSAVGDFGPSLLLQLPPTTN